MTIKLRMNCTITRGNGYTCHCCRTEEDEKLEEYTLAEILHRVAEIMKYNDDVIFDRDHDLTFTNTKGRSNDVLEDCHNIICDIVDKEIKRLGEIYKLKKKIGSAQTSLNGSVNFVHTVNTQIDRHNDNIVKQTQIIDDLNSQLITLENSAPKIK